MQLAVVTDRSQGGSSLKDGSLELMVRGEPHPFCVSHVRPTQTQPDLKAVVGTPVLPVALVPILFPFFPFFVPGFQVCITMPGFGIIFLYSLSFLLSSPS